MPDTGWYRRTTWSAKDQMDFRARFGRSRSAANKAQYLRIQALHLQQAGGRDLLRAALDLLDEVLRDYPERSELASVYLQQGECLEALGHGSDAIDTLRRSLETQRSFPFSRNWAHLVFGEMVLRHGRRELYPEALQALADLGDLDDLPIEKYRHQAIRASILDDLGRSDEACEAATLALTASSLTKSPLRNHPRVGLVGSPDPGLQQRLMAIAARSGHA